MVEGAFQLTIFYPFGFAQGRLSALVGMTESLVAFGDAVFVCVFFFGFLFCVGLCGPVGPYPRPEGRGLNENG